MSETCPECGAEIYEVFQGKEHEDGGVEYLRRQLAAKTEELATEKARRVEYQDVVYAVCVELDKELGRSPSRGNGTTIDQLVDSVRGLIEFKALAELARLREVVDAIAARSKT